MVFLQALALCGSALLEDDEVLGDGLGLPERVPEVRSLRGGRLLRCQREKLLQDDGVGCDGADESVDVPGGRRRGGPGRRKQRSRRDLVGAGTGN